MKKRGNVHGICNKMNKVDFEQPVRLTSILGKVPGKTYKGNDLSLTAMPI